MAAISMTSGTRSGSGLWPAMPSDILMATPVEGGAELLSDGAFPGRWHADRGVGRPRGYAVCQRIRGRIEEAFGWGEWSATAANTMLRGTARGLPVHAQHGRLQSRPASQAGCRLSGRPRSPIASRKKLSTSSVAAVAERRHPTTSSLMPTSSSATGARLLQTKRSFGCGPHRCRPGIVRTHFQAATARALDSPTRGLAIAGAKTTPLRISF